MKINYKITTIVLATLLALILLIHWEDIFSHNRKYDGRLNNSMMNIHQMPDGSMMKDGSHNSMMDMSMGNMLTMMDGKTGRALEKEFITAMIPHHQGAVDMAKKLLADPSVSQRMKDFANQIITAQEGEIKMMNEWLKNY